MKSLVFVVMPILVLVSCKTLPQSNLSHDTENPVGSTLPYFWREQSLEEYLEFTLNRSDFGQFDASQMIDAGSPLNVRMQGWSDKIRAMLDSRYPEMLTSIPRPIIRLVNAEINNAFVGTSPVCYENVFMNTGGEVNPAEGDCSNGFKFYENTIYAESRINFPKQKASFALLSALINNQNNSRYDCKLQLLQLGSKNYEIKAREGCKSIAYDQTQNFVFEPISNQITMFLGNLKLANEDEAVGVLAHELAHYYQAHGLVNRNVDYAYELRHSNSKGAPPRYSLADSEKWVQRYKEREGATEALVLLRYDLTSPLAPELYTMIPHQRIHGYLAQALKEAVDQTQGTACENGAYAKLCGVCSEANELANEEFMAGIPLGLIGDEPDSLRATYTNFESKALECLSGIKILETVSEPYIDNTRSYKAFQRYLEQSLPLSYTPDTIPYFEGSYADYFHRVSDALSVSKALERKDKSYVEYLKVKKEILNFSAKIEQVKTDSRKINSFFTKGEIGYYSIEQEADEIAAEWMHLMGFGNRVVGDASLNWMESPSDRKACEAMREQNWMDSLGKPIMIPWGPLDDAHPESCFRVRDADLEALAHGYKAIVRSPAADLRPAWDELLKDLIVPSPAEIKDRGDNNRSQAARVRSKNVALAKVSLGRSTVCEYKRMIER